jgi:NAD(P)-dependent dehydrogenase (short-subunit alcohol dehydrogenase family)
MPAAAPGPAKLAGKSALITGGSRGIGLAIARSLAAEGCSVAITARGESDLARAREILGSGALAIAADVSDPKSVADLFSGLRQAGRQRLDILVNNAGRAGNLANVGEIPFEEWQRTIAVNLTGPFLVTQAALPMIPAGGIIVNTLSTAARNVFPGMAAYAASKHGLLGFTETLREELRAKKIRVLALLPGATDTEIWQQFWPDAPRQKMVDPSSVAAAVLLAVTMPEGTSVDEIRIQPAAGKL